MTPILVFAFAHLLTCAVAATPCDRSADLNCDGRVDLADLAIMQRAIAPAPTPTPSPSPTPSPCQGEGQGEGSRFSVNRWGTVPNSPGPLVLYALGATSVTFNGVCAERDLVTLDTGEPVPGYRFALAASPGTYTAVVDGVPLAQTMIIRQLGETIVKSGAWSLAAAAVPVTPDKWITYTGGTCASAVIPPGAWVRFDRVTFNVAGALRADPAARLWFDHCDISNNAVPVNTPWRYYTNCKLHDCGIAAGNAQLIWRCTAWNLRNDLAQNCPLVAETTVDGIDPGAVTNPEHADVWQWWGGPAPDCVLYRVRATRVRYQGGILKTFGGGCAGFGAAFCSIDYELPTRRSDGRGAFLTSSGVQRLFVEHCTFADKGWTLSTDPDVRDDANAPVPVLIPQAHVRHVTGAITIGRGVIYDRSDWSP